MQKPGNENFTEEGFAAANIFNPQFKADFWHPPQLS
jgi:hypothetical protein